MAKLAAFYSRADENYFSGGYRYVTVGNTEKVAKVISELTGADLFKIEQKIPYAADYNTCIQQAKEDLRAKARPELVSAPDSLDGYDEIYLGFPNYWGDMPMAVIPFWKNLIGTERQFIPSVPMRGAVLAERKERFRVSAKARW